MQPRVRPSPLELGFGNPSASHNPSVEDRMALLLRAAHDGYVPKIKSELSRWTRRLRFLCALDDLLTLVFLLLLLVRVSGSDRIVVGCCCCAALAKRLEEHAGMSVDEAVRWVQAPWSKRHGPLHMAASAGKIKACKYLINDLGLDVNATGTDGSCLLLFLLLHDIRWVSTRRDGMVGPLDHVSEHGKGDFDLIYGIGHRSRVKSICSLICFGENYWKLAMVADVSSVTT